MLHLCLAPVRDDPEAWTTFRVIGVASKEMTVTGPDRTTVERGAEGLIVRVRRLAADLELRPA